MTQYDEVVEHQRLLIEAEEWSWGFKSLHVHAIQSCWYETEETKKHTADGTSVTDIQYNNGVIIRSKNGKEIHRFGKAKEGEELVRSYVRNSQR
tara:strand:+ start:246 stop:527 length:282 start_codon:yes stop_codon:yes gene_type:complete